MNKIYKSVYVEHLGTWVAVSELSAAKGKRSGSVRGLASVLGGLSLIGVLGLLPGKATAIAIGETGFPATAGFNAVAIGASAVAV